MKRWHSRTYYLILSLVIALVVSLVIPEDLFSRRGGGSRGRSSGGSWGSKSSRSRTSSRTPRTKPKRTSSRSTAKRSSTGSAKSDRALYKKAKAQGTVYKTRAEAKRAFASKYGNKYPSRYATKPASRPSHIPRTTTVGGKKYDVVYNADRGGYGYFGPGGGWMMYSVMRDAAMLGLLMNNRGYYYGAPPRGYGCGSGFLTTLLLIGGLILVIKMFSRRT